MKYKIVGFYKKTLYNNNKSNRLFIQDKDNDKYYLFNIETYNDKINQFYFFEIKKSSKKEINNLISHLPVENEFLDEKNFNLLKKGENLKTNLFSIKNSNFIIKEKNFKKNK